VQEGEEVGTEAQKDESAVMEGVLVDERGG